MSTIIELIGILLAICILVVILEMPESEREKVGNGIDIAINELVYSFVESDFRQWSFKYSDYDGDRVVTEDEYKKFRSVFMNQNNLFSKSDDGLFYDQDGNPISGTQLNYAMSNYENHVWPKAG